jgi:hypothetical protein
MRLSTAAAFALILRPLGVLSGTTLLLTIAMAPAVAILNGVLAACLDPTVALSRR